MKRLLAVAIVFCMSINSFAAIVADNDGSAFITKAEFDSLKNSFQSQIDNYNSSIDSKIDGAIAAYLAGIKTATTENRNNNAFSLDEVVCLDLSDETGIAYKYGNVGLSGRTGYNYLALNVEPAANKYKKCVEWDMMNDAEDIHKLLVKKTINSSYVEWVGYTEDARESYSVYGITENNGASTTSPQKLSFKAQPSKVYWEKVSELPDGKDIGHYALYYETSGAMSSNLYYRGRVLNFGTIKFANAIIYEGKSELFNWYDGTCDGFGNENAYDVKNPNDDTNIPTVGNVVTKVAPYVYAMKTNEYTPSVNQNDSLGDVTNPTDALSENRIWPGDSWVKDVTDWNNVTTTKFGLGFDGCAGENGTFLYNGFPLVTVNKEEKVSWRMKIKEPGTYTLIAGLSPFKTDNTTTNPVDMKLDGAAFKRVIELTGGEEHTIKFDFAEQNPLSVDKKTLWIKWSKKDSNGGGTLDLSSNYKQLQVTKDN